MHAFTYVSICVRTHVCMHVCMCNYIERVCVLRVLGLDAESLDSQSLD
jgi:hypothetical protein